MVTSTKQRIVSKSIDKRKKHAPKFKNHVLTLVLVTALCLMGIPVSLDAIASENNDISQKIKTEISYQALTEDAAWVDVNQDQVLTEVANGTAGYRVLVNWHIAESGVYLANNDMFTLALDEALKNAKLDAEVLDDAGTSIGSATIDTSGDLTALIDKLDGSNLTSGRIEISPAEYTQISSGTSGGSILGGSEGSILGTPGIGGILGASGAEGSEGIGIMPLAVPPPSGDPNDAGSFGQISLVKFEQLSNGCMGGIALDSAGRVWTFGYNLYGQLGIGKTNSEQNYYGGMRRIPYFIDNNIKIVEIGASYETRYALSDTGTVYVWGHGANGAMGDGSSTLVNTTPKAVAGLPKIEHIFPSDSYLAYGSCFALAENGELYAWGYNSSGQLGLGSTGTRQTPVKVNLGSEFDSGTRTIEKVTIGRGSAHLLDNQGDLWTAGTDSDGEQGNGPGSSPNLIFTKMDRSLTGMGKVIDVDTSYSALQGSADRVVAADENGDAWEWGKTFGDGGSANSAVVKQTPQKIIVSAAEISAYGYTPKAMAVTSSEMVSYFIDQHGRPWGWGSGYYFGFGREGGYEDSNSELIKSTAALQVPKILGDGDTQIYDSREKLPVYKGGGIRPSSRGGYGFNDLHPTIYDEKYMLKDSSGMVLDTDGNRIKRATAASMNGVSGLTIGKYYRVDSSGNVTSPATEGMPAVDPTEALWIDLAFQDVPYIKQMDCSLSAYAFLDYDGNIFKWGNDGSGAIAWGWDYESQYDQNGSLERGLYDRYLYEVMYMRGAPTIDTIDLGARLKTDVKLYKDPVTGDVTNTAEISVHIPATVTSAELSADVHSDLVELKYVFVPYDKTDPNFTADVTTMTQAQFDALYAATDNSKKGSLISSPAQSGSTAQDLSFDVNVPDNGRIIVWGYNQRYVDAPGGGREYEVNNDLFAGVVADNVYTPVTLQHQAIGVNDDGSELALHAPTTDNVKKTNDDSAHTKQPLDTTLYGLPLDANGNTIGVIKDASGNISLDPTAAPTYGYDRTNIDSYEAVGDVGLPSGIKPYWKFKSHLDDLKTIPQPLSAAKDMHDGDMLLSVYVHPFYYERDLDYWTIVDGEKTWSDSDDRLGFRPASVTLTLKQYERDTTTGAKGNFIKDVESKSFGVDAAGKWTFSFGSQMSYEYTYEIVETPVPSYTTTITYPHLVVGPTTNEDFSEISVLNTLNLKPVKFNKVDSLKSPITSDTATFELKNATTGGKVLDDAGVEQSVITLSTSAASPYIVMPIQKPGNYLLTETKAPSGYNLLTLDIEITIAPTGDVSAKLGILDLEEVTLSGPEVNIYAKAFNIVNKSSADLPLTGGSESMLILLGLCVALFVCAGLMRKRNHNANSSASG